jgi:hypothetical protein
MEADSADPLAATEDGENKFLGVGKKRVDGSWLSIR